MGTKKPASPTAVVAAGRQCLRPPLPRPSASGVYRTLPENVMRVNYSGRNRADCNACLMACRRMRTTQESLLVGANGYHDFKRRNVQPIVGRLRRRPYADRHSMLRLSHECTARLPGSPALKKERIRPNRVCRLLQDLELAASAYSADARPLICMISGSAD